MSRKAVATLALLAAQYAAAAPPPPGDPARGAAIYDRCAACHALAYNRTGPKHCGLFGRRAGSAPDFEYSPAMAKAKFKWNAETLDRFLENPTRTVPGTTMGYAGIPDPRERADLIAWLRVATADPAECRR
ncbi:c-type cytochrome [Azoarcus sp. DN11]|uniref:c-type cytochrome n=1 Tax=Azoarcus sp. DN11 TaxID=356837 RepID=UPI000EB30A86|nr:c-type cytochrome [Azoarcus sp. DN11]AYH44813.1 cytochrome c family protein [Azoarcus sp. DN11]